MKIIKGDQVLIIKGKDRGKKGKVLRGFPKETKVLIEGVNIKKVHKRPKKEGEKGQVVEVPSPIDVSKIRLICPKCGKLTKVGYTSGDILPRVEHKVREKSKIRVCKKCKEQL